jgi:hypothetical protein
MTSNYTLTVLSPRALLLLLLEAQQPPKVYKRPMVPPSTSLSPQLQDLPGASTFPIFSSPFSYSTQQQQP